MLIEKVGAKQGQGIFLFNDIKRIAKWKKAHDSNEQADRYVVCKYIENPYLVGGLMCCVKSG
jgi:tubulin polyglutamylase TTLL9